jgi:hypothetical protein
MRNRTTAHHTGTFRQVVAVALPIILFVAVLLFAILVSLRYAQGWVDVVSEGAAAAISMAGNGLAAAVSALVAAVGVVWLYLRRLAH